MRHGMKAVHIFSAAAVLVASVLLCGGCVNFSKVGVSDMKVRSYTPKSFSSLDMKCELSVENGSQEFTVSSLEGTIVHQGRNMANISVDPVTVLARTSAVYPVHGVVRLEDGVSLLNVISLANGFKPDEYTVNVSGILQPKGGAKFKISRKDVPLTFFMKKK